MKYNSNNKPLVCMLTNSTCYKGTNKMKVKGVLWHSTGANNPLVSRYVQPYETDPNYNKLITLLGKNKYNNDWNHITYQAGVNAFIGKLANGSVASVQTMPWDYRPWGCGTGSKGTCNDGWIQFECSEDGLNNRDYFNKVYKEACELTAYLCKMYNLDPYGTVNVNGVKVPVILCHADSHKLGLGSNHGDILHWFGKYGKTMDDVRKDVAVLMGKSVATSPAPTTSSNPIKVGNVVKITGTKYYNGKTIPEWVRKKNWIISSVSGDRIIINKSADGKNAISSPIHSQYLTVVSNGTATSTAIIRKGSKVKIKNGAKTYTGGKLASFVYSTTYTVLEEPKNDRVIIGINGVVTAVINKKDLIIV